MENAGKSCSCLRKKVMMAGVVDWSRRRGGREGELRLSTFGGHKRTGHSRRLRWSNVDGWPRQRDAGSGGFFGVVLNTYLDEYGLDDAEKCTMIVACLAD